MCHNTAHTNTQQSATRPTHPVSPVYTYFPVRSLNSVRCPQSWHATRAPLVSALSAPQPAHKYRVSLTPSGRLITVAVFVVVVVAAAAAGGLVSPTAVAGVDIVDGGRWRWRWWMEVVVSSGRWRLQRGGSFLERGAAFPLSYVLIE